MFFKLIAMSENQLLKQNDQNYELLGLRLIKRRKGSKKKELL